MYATSTLALALSAFAPTALGAVWNVTVGANGKLAYDPPYINAAIGDTVNFQFNPKNHTVTQSAFDPPCVPLAGGNGFKTGFVPVAAGTDPLPVKSFMVSSSAAQWFYCGQTGHCGQGMVFAINPPTYPNPNTFDAFQALAIARNGTAATATSAAPSTYTPPSTYTAPPAPQWTEATATVTWGGSVYTTTYASYAGTPAPTPAVTPQEHRIIVGVNGTLAYSPANITALINDTVVFEFHPKNHTVTQSSFINPCTSAPGGFKSGFNPVSANATEFPTFSIKINDTAPIWGYCGQVGHCQAGMVFSINAVESGPNNFAAFQMAAKNSANTSSSTTGSGSTSSTTGSGSAAPGGTTGSSSGAGMISPSVGISVGTVLFAGLTALFL